MNRASFLVRVRHFALVLDLKMYLTSPAVARDELVPELDALGDERACTLENLRKVYIGDLLHVPHNELKNQNAHGCPG